MAQLRKCTSLHLGSGHISGSGLWAAWDSPSPFPSAPSTMTDRKGRKDGRKEGRKKETEISFVPKGWVTITDGLPGATK